MRRSNWTVLAFAMLFLNVVSLPCRAVASDGEKEGEEEVRFFWAFGARVGPERDLVAITRDTTLQTGDELKMLVDVQRPCFVYLVYHSSQGEISLLFPRKLRQTDVVSRTPTTYHIPDGEVWFALDDHPGRETFYLLAAAERLTELEARLKACDAAAPSDKSEHAAQVLTHIRELRKRHRTLSVPAKRPVSVAATVRGASDELAGMAVEISANHFYGKTFTIEHR